jgi:prolyl-tRNA synthetase
VQRFDNKKGTLKIIKLKDVKKILDDIQKEMMKKSQKFLKDNIKDIKNKGDLKNIFGFARANWCGSEECEKNLKSETGGAEIRGTLFGATEKIFGDCIYCGKKAKHVVYVAKAY